MLCAAEVRKSARSVSGLEVGGRLCGEGGPGMRPCEFFVSSKTSSSKK